MNPQLMDLIITGNIIYDKGRDGIYRDGEVVYPEPRYHWAIWFDEEWMAQSVVMENNIFHPGDHGVTNWPGVGW